MAAPQNEFSFDLDIMKQAAESYYKQTPQREHNLKELKEKRYTSVESRERLAKRANHLIDKVKQALPYRAEALSDQMLELVARGRIMEDEITNDLMERVIGETRDFLSIEFLERGVLANRAVGRIVTQLGGGRASYGTGFLVSPHLLVTNWHVLKSKDAAASSAVEFDYQLDLSGSPLMVQNFELDPARFFLNDKGLDFALVAVKEVSARGKRLADLGWCPLIGTQGKIILGNAVNIIQHPRGEMKQVVIRENKLVDLPESVKTVAHYEGDTEPGSSGSPVYNDQWEVVALHHSGVPKKDADGNFLDIHGNIWKNEDDPSRLAWVANEGIRVSCLVQYIASAKVQEHEKQLRDEVVRLGESIQWQPKLEVKPGGHDEDVIQSGVTHMKSSDAHSSISVQAGSVTVTIPLNITISLGSSVTSQAAVRDEAPREGELERIEPDQDYDTRPGYDPNFLGFPVPLPKLTNSIRPLAVEIPGADGPKKYELKYYHYSVIMNGKRRLAFVSAVNFDANAKFKHKRETGGDKWFIDPRIKEFQAGEQLYAGNPLDRGHLTRRADAAWGTTKGEAKLANDDTFHFSNCSPQHEIFNQPTKANKKGLLLWGNIEEHIAEQARVNKKKLCVFNGPVFRANDRKYRGIQLPKEFWKIVVFEKDDEKPSALAFLLSQASLVKDLPEEEFEVGPYEPFQVRVREIETKTKLDLDKLRTFDPLEAEENESFFEARTEAVLLKSLDDIII